MNSTAWASARIRRETNPCSFARVTGNRVGRTKASILDVAIETRDALRDIRNSQKSGTGHPSADGESKRQPFVVRATESVARNRAMRTCSDLYRVQTWPRS